MVATISAGSPYKSTPMKQSNQNGNGYHHCKLATAVDTTTKASSTSHDRSPAKNGYHSRPSSNLTGYRPPPSISANATTSSLHDRSPSNSQEIDRIFQNSRSHLPRTSSFDRLIDTLPDEELGRVPPILLQQLARANEVIKQQSREMERLRAASNAVTGDRAAENSRLRQQLEELDEEVKKSRTNFLTQESLLSDMNSELQALLEERRILQTSYGELEKKYKRTKLANRELAKALEYGFDAEESTSRDDYHRRSEESLLELAREHAKRGEQRQADDEDTRYDRHMPTEKQKQDTGLEKRRDYEDKDQRNQTLHRQQPSTSANYQSPTFAESKQLREQFDREVAMNQSLHKDLEQARKMLLERDAEIAALKSTLAEMQRKLVQAESDAASTSSDLALERGRCDQLAIEQQETITMYNQLSEGVQLLAVEKEQLEHDYKLAKQTILTLNAKLEAQGADLVTTKRALRERTHLRTEL